MRHLAGPSQVWAATRSMGKGPLRCHGQSPDMGEAVLVPAGGRALSARFQKVCHQIAARA